MAALKGLSFCLAVQTSSCGRIHKIVFRVFLVYNKSCSLKDARLWECLTIREFIMPLFESPVGPQNERNAGAIWGSAWIDRNIFGTRYEVNPGSGVFSLHTGADLNLIIGQDENAQVFAMGAGTVTFADIYPDPKVWGGLVIIYHGVIDGRTVYSRYAHVKNIIVRKDDRVTKGQPIAQIGGRELGFDPHLHFDISITDVLDGDFRAAGFWPKDNADLLNTNFINPLDWLSKRQQMRATRTIEVSRRTLEWLVVHPNGAEVRRNPGIAAEVVKKLDKGSTLMLKNGAGEGGFMDELLWGQVGGGSLNNCWVAVQKKDKSEDYLIVKPD